MKHICTVVHPAVKYGKDEFYTPPRQIVAAPLQPALLVFVKAPLAVAREARRIGNRVVGGVQVRQRARFDAGQGLGEILMEKGDAAGGEIAVHRPQNRLVYNIGVFIAPKGRVEGPGGVHPEQPRGLGFA